MIALLALTALVFADAAHFDLPSGGTIRLIHSIGELDIEAWDRPDVEVMTIKPDTVHVAIERKGDELVITSEHPKHKRVEVEYRIKAPRGARLTIDHDRGEVNLDGITGDIHATNGCGDIALRLPDGAYAIDAKSKIGAVTSDFSGAERRKHWFGEQFDRESPPPAANLYLRIGFGDIIVLRMRRPSPPTPYAAP